MVLTEHDSHSMYNHCWDHPYQEDMSSKFLFTYTETSNNNFSQPTLSSNKNLFSSFFLNVNLFMIIVIIHYLIVSVLASTACLKHFKINYYHIYEKIPINHDQSFL